MRQTLFSGLILALASVAVADEAEKPKLGDVFFPDAIRFVTAVSQDQEACTMLFDNFVLSSSDGKGSLLEARTKSFSVSNKLEAKDAVSATIDVRGFVSLQEGGSAAVIVHAGGETTLVDLSKAIAAATSKANDPESELLVKAKELAKSAGFTVDARPKESNDFQARVTAKFAKGQPLQATVILLVDRLPAADSEALITVDSVDIEVKGAPVDKADKAEKKADEPKREKKSSDKKSDDKKKASEKDDADKEGDKRDNTKAVEDSKSDE